MALSECKNCSYCQKRWNRDRYGNLVDGYYSCNCAPHWGKNIETIYKCPKTFTQKDVDAVARKLNGF